MSIYQITAKATISAASQIRNVHHYEFPGYVPELATLQEAVDRLDAAYYTVLRGYFHQSVLQYGYDVRRVDLGDQPQIELSATAGDWSGTNTSDRMPAQIAGLVSFRAFTVFPRTARSFLFPMGEENSDATGKPSVSTLAVMETWAAAILTLDITGFADAVKVTVRYGGDPRVVEASNVLTTVGAATQWATQRSRKGGVGI